MTEEIFGPILTVHTPVFNYSYEIYVYEDADWHNVLKLVDESSDYALTGSMYFSPFAILTIVSPRIGQPSWRQPTLFVTRPVPFLTTAF